MGLAQKLNLKSGMKARVVGKPAAGPVVSAGKQDRIAWLAHEVWSALRFRPAK